MPQSLHEIPAGGQSNQMRIVTSQMIMKGSGKNNAVCLACLWFPTFLHCPSLKKPELFAVQVTSKLLHCLQKYQSPPRKQTLGWSFVLTKVCGRGCSARRRLRGRNSKGEDKKRTEKKGRKKDRQTRRKKRRKR